MGVEVEALSPGNGSTFPKLTLGKGWDVIKGWDQRLAKLLAAGDEAAVTVVAKPQMRGLLRAAIKRNLIVAFTLAAISGGTFKVLVADERKRKYAEFYRTYDAEKEFEEIRRKGLFQSC